MSDEIVRPARDVDAIDVSAGSATTTRVLLSAADGAPHFAMRRFTMGEGGGMPRHTNTVEHEQYVLRGRGRVAIGDKVYEVGPDDVLYIPAGVAHSYEVIEAPFEFLCMVPNAPDEIEIVEPGS
jgi:quercetin dioxygenase-like cupin family protein